MKKIFIFLFIGIVFQGYSQTGIIINSGAKLSGNNAYIKINNADYINNSSDDLFNVTVVFSGNNEQTIGGTTNSSFSNMLVNNSNNISLESNLFIEDELNIQNGSLVLNDNNLVLSAGSSIIGNFSSNNMIDINGSGKLIKEIENNDDILFPIGNSETYSPVEIAFNSGTYTNAYYSVDVESNKHPDNNSSADYLNRYWTINSVGITNFISDLVFHYNTYDIVGSESEIYGGLWTGTWNILNKASILMFSGQVSEFGDFTGGEQNAFSSVQDLQMKNIEVFYNDGFITILNPDQYEITSINCFDISGKLLLNKKAGRCKTTKVPFLYNTGYYNILISTNTFVRNKMIFVP
jgi:hypothetical protein